MQAKNNSSVLNLAQQLNAVIVDKLCTITVNEKGHIVNIAQAKSWAIALSLLTPEQRSLPLVSEGVIITDEYLSICELMEMVAVTPQ